MHHKEGDMETNLGEKMQSKHRKKEESVTKKLVYAQSSLVNELSVAQIHRNSLFFLVAV
jgi:hypothetical protein